MQLFAFDQSKQVIPARHALKKEDYYCRECGRVLRVRKGIHKQTHYYHLNSSPSCRQSGKSLEHLHVQYYLLGALPDGEAFLERSFPEVGRIADVVWEKEMLVFEVQCSSISREEVALRMRDYGQLGYQVVWILHERKFNKWRVTAAEIYLQRHPYYFTDMDVRGNGGIYDQVALLKGGTKKVFRKIYGVAVAEPRRLAEGNFSQEAPKALRDRLSNWPMHFVGDLLDLYFRSDRELQSFLEHFERHTRSFYPKAAVPLWEFLVGGIHRYLVRPYLLILQLLLEKSCK